MCALGVNNQFAIVEEIISHGDHRIQVTSRIISQIYYQLFCAILLQLVQRLLKFIVSSCTEPVYFNVARYCIKHYAGFNAICRYQAAGNRYLAQHITGNGL